MKKQQEECVMVWATRFVIFGFVALIVAVISVAQ